MHIWQLAVMHSRSRNVSEILLQSA